MKCMLVLAALALQPVMITPVRAENLKVEFNTAWASRETLYVSQIQETEAHQAAAIKAFGAAAQASAPDTGAKMQAMFDAISEYGVAKGRKAALGDFRAFFASNPSAAATEIWLQGQTSELQRMVTKGNAQAEAVKLLKPGQGGITPQDYLERGMQSVGYNSLVRGAIEETQLVDQNLGTYFRAKTADDVDRRRRRATIFGILAAGLGGAARAATPPPPQFPQSPQTIRCTTYFNSTVCSGQ